MPAPRKPEDARLNKIEGAWLRYWRLQKRFSQEAMASRVGVTTRAYQKYERGETHMRNGRVMDFAKFLSVRFDQIRRVDPPPTKG